MIKRFGLTAFVLTSALTSLSSQANTDFEQCKIQLKTTAAQHNLTSNEVTKAIEQMRYQARVIELDRSQPEFVQTFPGYFGKRVSNWRIDKGRQMLAKHKTLLQSLTQQYGVPAHYLMAFWGLETNFGQYKGKMPVLDSLATLACDPRRSEYFTQELMVALEIMQREALTPEQMIGSWAGAMGHTQFMPSAYKHYAKDGDGDSQINLWESEEDALTSAANFLSQLGWQPGFRWGREIRLPADFDFAQTGKQNRQAVDEWAKLGLTDALGKPLPKSDTPAYVVVPAGHQGPAFLVYKNFNTIMRWNNSEFYAIAVGHLADRILGLAPLAADLPKLPNYSRGQIINLQKELNQKGFDVGKPDGIIGPATRHGLTQYQRKQGFVADGFPSLDVMHALGVVKQEEQQQQDS